MTEQTYLTMNNGNQIPQFGLGVFQVPAGKPTEDAVAAALNFGIRHIDTAHAYQNEASVGKAVKASGIKRDEIFITSKLWPSEYGLDKTPQAIDKMLKRLGTDYLDLLLLHQQVGDYLGAYQAMEVAQKAGKVKSIGISNFDGERLDDLLANVEVKPAIAQVELHPYYPETALRNKLKPFGTILESWYPLGHGDPALINEPIFTELGKKYHKSNVQIILRWHLQMGNVVFPRTTNVDHMQDNFDIFDFELTADEMKKIAMLDKDKRYFTMPYQEQKATFTKWRPAD